MSANITPHDIDRIDRRLARMETLLARLVDRVLDDGEDRDYSFNPVILAQDILARGPAAAKEHNQRRQRQMAKKRRIS